MLHNSFYNSKFVNEISNMRDILVKMEMNELIHVMCYIIFLTLGAQQ